MDQRRFRVNCLLPLFLSAVVVPAVAAPPMVMLAISRDESYFHEAWPDHLDVDGDGVPDPGYVDSVDYDGYFHPKLCYRYDDADGRFEPAGWNDGSANHHYCTGTLADTFSGNFLNWATMTRMDLLRRALYGGRRVVDTTALTVLERAHLPTDAHSFAKTYNGDEVKALTPFESNANLITDGDGGDEDGFQDANEGVTVCNTSYAASGNSQTTTAPPVVRFVYGNRSLWDANERWQCTWETERGDNTNANVRISSGMDSVSSDPLTSQTLTTPNGSLDHIARVLACDPAWFDAGNDAERCRDYPDGNRKPAGILQQQGESGFVAFGLVTGSWDRNLSGGALRKRPGDMADEINVTGNGSFKLPSAGGGIIKTLETMRVWGYSYGTASTGSGNGTYFGGSSGDNCGFQLATIAQGDCNAWGNPVAEIYLEALRYFAVNTARAPTPAFDPDDEVYFPGMTDAAWTPDALAGLAEMPSLNVLVINAGIPSYDHDATGSAILGGTTPQAVTDAVADGEGITGNSYLVGRTDADGNEFCTAKTVDALGDTYGICPLGPTLNGSYHAAGLAHYAHVTDMRSDIEGVQSIAAYVVELPPDDAVVTIPIGNAGAAQRVTLQPAYRLVGNKGGGALVDFKVVRKHTEVDPSDRAKPGLPNTTPDPTTTNGACPGVSGTGADIVNGVPTSVVLTSTTTCRSTPPGSSGQLATTMPVAKAGTGLFHGKFHLAWDDSEQGADYDQDVWGILDYVVDTTASPPTITVTTSTLAESTVGGQLFGFVIEGTTQDGFHAYSGIDGADFVDPGDVPGCANCQVISAGVGQRGPQSYTFTIGSDPQAGVLESPLHYAAKWGGFVDSDGDGTPNQRREWDVRGSDGELTQDIDPLDAVPDGDGVPDQYFQLATLASLDEALASALALIAQRATPDFDGDGHPDATDPDDDNDGLPDAWELAYGFNPTDAADAALDSDGDSRSNLIEYQDGTHPGVQDTPAPGCNSSATVTSSERIVNGDFEAGNAGFSSQYAYPMMSIGPGQFGLFTDLNVALPSAVPYRDHTIGTGLMFAADGATTSDVVLWEQTLAIEPHSCYRFVAWVGSFGYAAPPPRPDFTFNGTSVGIASPPVYAGSGIGLWTPFTAHWYSGDEVSLTIQIVGRELSVASNDTALDDISLVTVATAPVPAQVPLPDRALVLLAFLLILFSLAASMSRRPAGQPN